MISDKSGIGGFLRKMRIKRGLTQQQLAESIGLEAEQYVSGWERGVCGPPLNRLYELTIALGIDPDELMKLILIDTKKQLQVFLKIEKY